MIYSICNTSRHHSYHNTPSRQSRGFIPGGMGKIWEIWFRALTSFSNLLLRWNLYKRIYGSFFLPLNLNFQIKTTNVFFRMDDCMDQQLWLAPSHFPFPCWKQKKHPKWNDQNATWIWINTAAAATLWPIHYVNFISEAILLDLLFKPYLKRQTIKLSKRFPHFILKQSQRVWGPIHLGHK